MEIIFGKRPGSSPINKRGKRFEISVYRQDNKIIIDIYSVSGNRFYQTTSCESIEECQEAYDSFLYHNF
jgi:hypothetical protein